MAESTPKILTTHTGSLCRAPELSRMLIAQERGVAVDENGFWRVAKDSVRRVVAKQLDSGIDIGSDGEQPRVGFQTYVAQRMKGFGGESRRRIPLDVQDFPEYARRFDVRHDESSKVTNAPQAIEEIRYDDLSAATLELDLFRDCLDESPRKFTDAFMTAASPGIIATTLHNAWYDSHERYLMALASQMSREYELIHSRGFMLQLDAPDLAMERPWHFQDLSLAEFQKTIELHIAAINHSVRNIPPDRVRLHICWGNYDGPHNHDVALADILPILYQAKVGALSIELANPRHQHEHTAIRRTRMPDTMTLIPGVIDSTCCYIEHPEVVADRIVKAVQAVGDRTRVIAGTDCGFGTFAGWEAIPSDIVWAKLKTLSEGAAIASRILGD